ATTPNYNAADFRRTRCVATGTVVTFTYNSPIGSTTAGKRYVKTAGPTPASPVTVNSNTSVSATSTPQFQVTFAQSGIGGDTGANTVVTVDAANQTRGELPFTKF